MKKKTLIIFILICIIILIVFAVLKKSKIDEHSFLGKIIEVSSSYIIVEPNEYESERQSSDKFQIELKDNNTAYAIGDSVKITYTGNIKEKYISQIKSIKIELQPASKFKLTFYPKSNETKNLIINKNESTKYNYNIYIYNGDAEITINDKTYSLEEALKKDRITMENIIEIANLNCPDIRSANDGGSKEYHYSDYTIIKFHTIDGNRDVYIGDKNLALNDIKN